MGGGIAALLAGVGIPTLLLDIAPAELTAAESAQGLQLSAPAVRNRFVNNGLAAIKAARPAALFTPAAAALLTVGNLQDDFARLAEVDWVIEVIVENLDVKRSFYERLEQVRPAGQLVTSNTSGLPIQQLARVETFVAQGYKRVKLKIKPGWDVEPATAVRKQFPDLLLQVDANSAYTLADVARFQALDDLQLLLIEQPLHHEDIVDHARLQAQLRTPICLDESIHSYEHARWALDLNACKIINMKVGRVGGFTAALRIHQLCQERGIPLWCGGMLETNIGRAGNVALAALPNFTLPGDISASARYYHEDVASPDFVLNNDSTLTVPTMPGLGATVLRARLAAARLRHLEIKK